MTKLCGTPHYDYPETLCTEPAGHYVRDRDPHAGPLIVDGREIGGAAWDEPQHPPRHAACSTEEDVTDQPTNWHQAGCARDCTEQHTYTWGRCALAPETSKPEPTISILRVEPDPEGGRHIVTRSIPLTHWQGLIAVAKWVSRGKSFALDADPDIATCYPDATARFALGALHDAGLLDPPCDHSFPDPYPHPMDQVGDCRHCGTSYTDARQQYDGPSVAEAAAADRAYWEQRDAGEGP